MILVSAPNGAARYLRGMAISSPAAARPGGVGGSPKKFPEKFSDNGVRDKHHRVSDVSVTSFWITSRRVAVHVFPGTRAQVYTRDATHRPTATLTPGRGVLCLWSGGFVGGGRPPGVFVGENQGLF